MKMNRSLYLLAVLGCFSLFTATYYISETQAIVQSGLADLKFESVKQPGGLIGAPSHFKITKQTLEHLRALMKEGKQITVEADGKLVVVDGVAGKVGNGKKVKE
jgi:hypothetical protein